MGEKPINLAEKLLLLSCYVETTEEIFLLKMYACSQRPVLLSALVREALLAEGQVSFEKPPTHQNAESGD